MPDPRFAIGDTITVTVYGKPDQVAFICLPPSSDLKRRVEESYGPDATIWYSYDPTGSDPNWMLSSRAKNHTPGSNRTKEIKTMMDTRRCKILFENLDVAVRP